MRASSVQGARSATAVDRPARGRPERRVSLPGGRSADSGFKGGALGFLVRSSTHVTPHLLDQARGR